MDCLLCFKMFIGEKEFQNYKQNPQFCKKAIFELFRVSDTGLQGLSEDLVICLGCHRKLECVRDLVEQLKELQRKVDEAKVEIKQGLIDSKNVSEVMAKNFGDSMSKSSLDRLVLLKAIEGCVAEKTQQSAADHDGIDIGGSNEPSEGQQPQDLADEPETHDLQIEREGMLPSGAIKLKEVKFCLGRVQLPPGVSTAKTQVKSNCGPSNSNGRHGLRNSKPSTKLSTQIQESSNLFNLSDSSSNSEDDTDVEAKVISLTRSAKFRQGASKQPKRARGSLTKEFIRLKDGSFQCKHCPSIIKGHISEHLLIHGPRKFKCPVNDCWIPFTRKTQRDRHVKLVHEGRRDFKCGVEGCGHAAGAKQDLQRHMSSKHKKMGVAKKKSGCSSGHHPSN